ncbi:hypothetical protein DOK76_02815 [Vagococcus sp. DIV0080]|uniref:Uncharacterized protein n=1 Tax=Candidatus Vagococcus giribetii TaxID=2230876 RepID=A0ABS3HT18_9ENTE|nr:hypothetical protein [Vagococcus sp. DIV0080]MBO0475986.1 hypothetical protein [Vagococcus sp. DIV0080]
MNWKLGLIGSALLETFGNSKLWRTKWFIFISHTLSFLLSFFLIFLVLGLLVDSKPILPPILLILLALLSIFYGSWAHYIYKKID